MRKGFTLIEVLVGLAVLALVASLIQGVYARTQQSRRVVTDRVGEVHGVAVTLQKIGDELSMAFVSEHRQNDSGLFISKDPREMWRLEMTTRGPHLPEGVPGRDTRVVYEIAEVEGVKNLVRRELRDVWGDIDREGGSIAMLKEVDGFELAAYDGAVWSERWDMTAGVLPRAVTVKISWGGEEDPKVARTSTLVYEAQP